MVLDVPIFYGPNEINGLAILFGYLCIGNWTTSNVHLLSS